MKIKETYIVQEGEEFIKLHYCLNSQGTNMQYFKEYNNGVIVRISGSDFYELLKEC